MNLTLPKASINDLRIYDGFEIEDVDRVFRLDIDDISGFSKLIFDMSEFEDETILCLVYVINSMTTVPALFVNGQLSNRKNPNQ